MTMSGFAGKVSAFLDCLRIHFPKGEDLRGVPSMEPSKDDLPVAVGGDSGAAKGVLKELPRSSSVETTATPRRQMLDTVA